PSSKSVVKHMWLKVSQYLKKMGSVILIGSIIIWGLGYYPTQQKSYLRDIGHFIEPAIKPLGFDWKIGVALVTGIAAKEVVIGTMGVLNNIDNEDDEQGLAQSLQRATDSNGEKIYTPAVAMSLLLFILIYFPCVAVVAAIRRESGRWRWALFSMIYTTGLAWVVSFIVYNVMK
ncbi:MAG: nucleoside recognition domain-containing protein, partial [Rikenellaceae bacterium]